MSQIERDKTEELETPLAEDESEKQLSLMGGVMQAEDAEEPDSRGRKLLGQGTLLMVIVVIVAAGGIYFMRLTQGDLNTAPIPKEVDAKIEWALATHKTSDPNNPLKAENVDALLNDTESFVAMFSSDPTNVQVPLEYVQKNPFTMPTLDEPKADANPAVTNKRDQDLRKRLEAEASNFKLQSVLGGQTPVAMINGEIVSVGQKLGAFQVVSIASRSVDLESNGLKVTLHMAQ